MRIRQFLQLTLVEPGIVLRSGVLCRREVFLRQ